MDLENSLLAVRWFQGSQVIRAHGCRAESNWKLDLLAINLWLLIRRLRGLLASNCNQRYLVLKISLINWLAERAYLGLENLIRFINQKVNPTEWPAQGMSQQQSISQVTSGYQRAYHLRKGHKEYQYQNADEMHKHSASPQKPQLQSQDLLVVSQILLRKPIKASSFWTRRWRRQKVCLWGWCSRVLLRGLLIR